MKVIQKTAMLGTAKILRNVLSLQEVGKDITALYHNTNVFPL